MIESEQPKVSVSPGETTPLPACFVILSLAAWFLWPALFSVHVEAFSARLQSEAILARHGQLGLADQAYPIVTQYLYTSRQFTVLTLKYLMELTRSTGDINFRILIIGSYVLFVSSCLAFVRRWSGRSKWLAFAALILFPGLVEIAFFFADNLPSAALAVTAIALVSPEMPCWRCLAVGALFALAVLFRLDALFAVPSLAIVVLAQEDLSLREFFRVAALFGLAATAVFLLGWHISSVSLLQAYHIGAYFAHVQAGYTPWRMNLGDSLRLFFGLPALVAVGVGCFENWRTRSRRWNICMTVYPALLYLYYASKAIEVRDFLLLGAPFLVLQASTGICKSITLLRRSSRGRSLALCVCAICLLSVVSPPRIRMKDGPHAEIGRFWTTLFWRNWQKEVESNLDGCDQLIHSARSEERVLVITSMYNAEAYFQLRLLQDGYDILGDALSTPYNQADFVAKKNEKTFLVLRTETPYAILSMGPYLQPTAYSQAFQLSHALAGTASFRADRFYLLTWGGSDQQQFLADSAQFNYAAGPMEFTFPNYYAFLRRRPEADGRSRFIALTPQDIHQLESFGDSKVRAAENASASRWTPMHDFIQMHDALRLGYWQP